MRLACQFRENCYIVLQRQRAVLDGGMVLELCLVLQVGRDYKLNISEVCQLQHVCPTPNLPPVVCLLDLVQAVIRLWAADLGRFISYVGLTPGMCLVSGPLLQALNRWGLVLQALSPEESWQRASTNAAYLTMPLHGPTASWERPFCYREKVIMMEMIVTQF